jgi:hypothetical protein
MLFLMIDVATVLPDKMFETLANHFGTERNHRHAGWIAAGRATPASQTGHNHQQVFAASLAQPHSLPRGAVISEAG